MEELYPNSIFPYLPKEMSNIILQNVDPGTLPNLCLVNKNSHRNDCVNLLKYYYGNNGFDIINSMDLDQFRRLNNMIWPTLQSFNIQTDQIIKDQMIERALSLRYSDDIISQMSVPDVSLFAYNRINLMKSNITDLQIIPNVVKYLENGGNYQDVLIRLGLTNTNNFPLKVINRIISKNSSYPSIVFNKIKEPLFAVDDGNILKNIYELPLSQCDAYIIQNANVIKNSDIKSAAFVVYTQRQKYNAKIAAYLMKYAYNSIKVTSTFMYVVVLQNIELLRLAVIILSVFGGEFDYDTLLNPQFNIEEMPNIVRFKKRSGDPLSRIYEYSVQEAIIEYSAPIAFINATFLNNNLPSGFRILGNVNISIPPLLQTLRKQYDIIKLFSVLLVDKSAFDLSFFTTWLNYVNI